MSILVMEEWKCFKWECERIFLIEPFVRERLQFVLNLERNLAFRLFQRPNKMLRISLRTKCAVYFPSICIFLSSELKAGKVFRLRLNLFTKQKRQAHVVVYITLSWFMHYFM